LVERPVRPQGIKKKEGRLIPEKLRLQTHFSKSKIRGRPELPLGGLNETVKKNAGGSQAELT